MVLHKRYNLIPKRIIIMLFKKVCLVAMVGLMYCCSKPREQLTLPNILWITSEDNSPFLGCYGDNFATTPNLDQLASTGFLYTHAFANAPVCAPARNTIITGVYANSSGNQYMRSHYNKSDEVILYPEFLKKKGYYVTNNRKEDFNINLDQTKNVWNALGKDAHYKNRPENTPFFSIFNIGVSHESSIHTSIPAEKLRHKPENVSLPPYHPDTPQMRHDWAQYYDKVEDMDHIVGELLNDLEDSGEAENTIIMYYGDHGGVLARSKRFVYETGTRVPFILHIPEKYKKFYPNKEVGTKVNRLISFVDLAPTLLSILNIKIPNFMQGSAFLGSQKTKAPQYAYMFKDRMDERFDMSRAVRDAKYRYIRNYTPNRIYGQHINYLWRAPSVGSWEEKYKAGECNKVQSVFWENKPIEELYDTENDPWEVHNLAADPSYSNILERMRKANKDWMLQIKDTGFIPEATLANLSQKSGAYDYMRTGATDIKKIIEAANYATAATEKDIDSLIDLMKSKNESIRYWGATGLLIMGDKAEAALDALKFASQDSCSDAAIVASEALYGLGAKKEGLAGLLRILEIPNEMARTRALNVVDIIDENGAKMQAVVRKIITDSKGDKSRKRYDLRCANYLVSKWGLN